MPYCENCFLDHRNLPSSKGHNFTSFKPGTPQSEIKEITWKSIVLTKLIYRSPEGSTEVHEGKLLHRPGKYAIKIMYCRGDGDLTKKQREAEIQKKINHPNICECLAAFKESEQQGVDKFVLVMEFSEDGDIEQEIEKRKLKKNPWVESELMQHITEMIDAFVYLQSQNLTHGDIKPRNLYLTSAGKIKIGDFGESKQAMQALVTQTYQVTGTVVYFSPLLFNAYLDIIKGKNARGDVRHNPIKSDVYSLGLTILHMASLKKPTELNNLEIGIDNLQENVDKAIANVNYTDNVKMILTHMLRVQENKRYDFRQLGRYLNPNLNSITEAPKQTAMKPIPNLKTFDPQLISISQTQGKANVLDHSLKIMTLSSHRFQSSSRSVIYKDSAIIVGGLKCSKNVFKINVSTCAATKINDLNVGRSWHTLLFHQGLLFAIGGRSDSKEALGSTEILNTLNEDISRETWKNSDNLRTSRENATAISIDNSIFIVGGSNNENNRWELLGSIELYKEERWNHVPVELPEKCAGVGLLLNSKGNILLLGGSRGKGAYSNKILEYTISTGQIQELPAVLSESDFFSSLSYYKVNNYFNIMGMFIGCHEIEENTLQCELKRYNK